MNNKIFIKSIIVLAIIIIFLFSYDQYIYAKSSMDSVIEDAQSFINSGNDDTNVKDNQVKEVSDFIYNILMLITFVVVAVVGVILGIRIMMAPDANSKAEAKKSLLPFLIGTVVSYGAFSFWKLIITVLNQL